MGVRRRGDAAKVTLGAFCALLVLVFSLTGCDDRHTGSSSDPASTSASSMCASGLSDIRHDDRVFHAGHFTSLPGPPRSEHDDLPRAVSMPATQVPTYRADAPVRVPRCHGPPAAVEPAGREMLVRLCIWRR
ncbi:hypothetical protein ACTD5D_22305 [Nocardia takedensis]|uniref:hypothetical protein n=1 Tax=Nocardia takedensis TaxID=259390 RepID=UPI0005924ABB|nr:hypothetical protein [Nocardia takedensis]